MNTYKVGQVLISTVVLLCGLYSALVFAALPEVYDTQIVEISGRPGHQGFFPIESQPITGTKVIVRSRVFGVSNDVYLKINDSNGSLLERILMIAPAQDKETPGTYFSEIVVPPTPFSIIVSGLDENGNSFEASPLKGISTYAPQLLDMKITTTADNVWSEFPLFFSVNLANHGAADTFVVSLVSDAGGLIQPISAEVSLQPGASEEVQFQYAAPKFVSGMDMVKLTATATGKVINGNHNQATISVPIESEIPKKLNAWADDSSLEYKVNARKTPQTVVWVCNEKVNEQTVMIAYRLVAIDKEELLQDRNDQHEAINHQSHVALKEDDNDRKLCNAPSLLKLTFDTAELVNTISEGITIPTDQYRRLDVPITATSINGEKMIGYVSFELKKQDKRGDENAHR